MWLVRNSGCKIPLYWFDSVILTLFRWVTNRSPQYLKNILGSAITVRCLITLTSKFLGNYYMITYTFKITYPKPNLMAFFCPSIYAGYQWHSEYISSIIAEGLCQGLNLALIVAELNEFIITRVIHLYICLIV